MQISVSASAPYTVSVGRGLLKDLGRIAAGAHGPCRAAVVTDENVAPLYLDAAVRSLETAGFSAVTLTLPAGERYKTLDTFGRILGFFAASGLQRRDLAVALGGGVVGDVTGFAAGCYLRGIAFLQVPTTLLAMVDASVGGKTAVDLPAGKNLAGLFVQPAAVLCDADCLATLPRDQFASGMAEIVKTGVLFDPELFALCSDETVPVETLIARSVAHKARVVEADERESGPRKLLNLGHTVGHAVEKLSGYAVPHGHAVAAGLAVVTRAAAARALCPAGDAAAVCRTLARLGLPTSLAYPPEAVAAAAAGDKKRSGGVVDLIVPRRIGRCEIRPVPLDGLAEFLRPGIWG